MTSPPYGSWYLFGRYLAHQTENLDGGGNDIYKSILSQLSDEEAKAGDYLGPEDLEDALKAIGYIGGENGKVSDIEEVITNYNIALYLREPSGIYSLSNNSENPSDVDGVQVEKIFQTSEALKEIPGGGAAALVINENMEPAKPENPGNDIRFAGIENEFMNGAYAENADTTMVWGDKITLESMDGPDSEIKYTTDGSKPFAGGQVYTGPIVVTEPMTLSFCTVSKDGDYSPTETVIVEEVIAASVKAGQPSGPVEKGTEITLSTDMNDAVIRYTTDGSAPSNDNGTIYEDAIKIETTTTVKAVAYSSANEDILLSGIKTFVYEVEDGKGDRYEKNDTKDTATALSFPGEVNATIHNAKDSDWYSFTLDNGAALNLTLTPPAKSSFGLYLYDENGDEHGKSVCDNKSQNIRCEAKSGRYYLKVESTDKSFSAKNAYTLSLRKEMDADALADLDFSEMNMFTALSDKSETGSGYAYDLGIDGGGHFLMSMAYFANWDGPVKESEDPYHVKEDGAEYKYKDLSSKAEYHVQNALYLPNDTRENFIEHVKNAVYSYGAADIYILSAKAYQTENFKHFYLDGSYEYPNPYLDGGHIVTIVGWDDKYSKDNFIGNPDYAGGNELPRPAKDGAFIVKNSWGETAPWGDPVGDDGYFYLSYEDALMLSNTPAVYITDEASDNYNHQYYNDTVGTILTFNSNTSFAAEEHFTNESSSPELLKATSFQLMSSDTRYEIFVTCNGETKKVSEGVKKYAGFYTERLADPVLIPEGSDFSVKVYLESTEENKQAAIGVSVNYGGVVSCVEPQSGIAFIEANGIREDVGAENAGGAFPCIRAYTCDVNTDSYIKTTPDSSIKNSKKAAPEDENTNKTEGIWEDISMTPLNTETTNGITTLSLPDAGDTDVPDRDLPEEFDLRDTGTLTPVRNQGNLGSCWTFAAMASAENTAAGNGGFTKDYPESITLDSSEKSVLLSKDSGEIPVELTAAINGSENPASTKIFWSVSGDADSVRLDNTESFSGEKTQVLTAIKPGVVTITASSDADMSVKASCTLTITAQGVEKIVLNPTEMTMKKGEVKQIKAQTGPDDAVDSTIIWKSSNPEIAAVDSNGNVTAVSGGNAVITAKAGTAEAQTVVTVKGDPAVNPGSSDGNGSSKTGDDTNIIL